MLYLRQFLFSHRYQALCPQGANDWWWEIQTRKAVGRDDDGETIQCREFCWVKRLVIVASLEKRFQSYYHVSENVNKVFTISQNYNYCGSLVYWIEVMLNQTSEEFVFIIFKRLHKHEFITDEWIEHTFKDS